MYPVELLLERGVRQGPKESSKRPSTVAPCMRSADVDAIPLGSLRGDRTPCAGPGINGGPDTDFFLQPDGKGFASSASSSASSALRLLRVEKSICVRPSTARASRRINSTPNWRFAMSISDELRRPIKRSVSSRLSSNSAPPSTVPASSTGKMYVPPSVEAPSCARMLTAAAPQRRGSIRPCRDSHPDHHHQDEVSSSCWEALSYP